MKPKSERQEIKELGTKIRQGEARLQTRRELLYKLLRRAYANGKGADLNDLAELTGYTRQRMFQICVDKDR